MVSGSRSRRERHERPQMAAVGRRRCHRCAPPASRLRCPRSRQREAWMPDGFVIANFRHVADGLQEGQFAVGERKRAASLEDLDPSYRQLLDRPITQTLGIIGPDGRPSLTPMWFDYEDDRSLVKTASPRPKCE